VRSASRRFSPDWPFGWMPESAVVAHMTVTGPFLAPDRLDPDVVSAIREYCARQAVFSFTLSRVNAFCTGVVHRVPEPKAPFSDVMRCFGSRWPEAPSMAARTPDVPTFHWQQRRTLLGRWRK
jgi:hypothetical protein